MIASGLEHWTLILDGVRFAPNSVRLPEPAERPETEREGLRRGWTLFSPATVR